MPMNPKIVIIDGINYSLDTSTSWNNVAPEDDDNPDSWKHEQTFVDVNLQQ